MDEDPDLQYINDLRRAAVPLSQSHFDKTISKEKSLINK